MNELVILSLGRYPQEILFYFGNRNFLDYGQGMYNQQNRLLNTKAQFASIVGFYNTEQFIKVFKQLEKQA